jgi:hypothetical protein
MISTGAHRVATNRLLRIVRRFAVDHGRNRGPAGFAVFGIQALGLVGARRRHAPAMASISRIARSQLTNPVELRYRLSIAPAMTSARRHRQRHNAAAMRVKTGSRHHQRTENRHARPALDLAHDT